MKKIILSAFILVACCQLQAQTLGGLLNKAKDRAKNKSENSDKSENKNNNTSNNNTMTETKQVPAGNYTSMNDESYIRALSKKNSGMIVLKRLTGSNELAINEYYDKAVEVDMANFYLAMQKKGKPKGDGANDYDDIIKMRKEYPQIFDNDFKPLLDNTIETAYNLKKTNKPEAVKIIKLAMHLNEACLMVIPDLQSAVEMKKDIEKALTDIGGEQSKTFTGDFHKQNAGKILFSKEPIIPGKENPSQFTTNFGPDDRIYGIAYLPGTIQELTEVREGDDNVPGEFRMKVDNSIQPLSPQQFNHLPSDRNKSFFLIDVRPDPTKAIHSLDAVYFAEKIGDLSPRKHTLGIGFGSYQHSEPFAYGELKIDWTNGDANKIKADAKNAASNAQANIAKTVQVDEAFSRPNYFFKDASLSMANLKKAFMAATPNAVQILKMITIKEKNYSEDWDIKRNDYGEIVAKVTLHYTSFVYKAKDGNCYMHFTAQFGKAATGGGGYGGLAMNPTGMPDQRIACENVK